MKGKKRYIAIIAAIIVFLFAFIISKGTVQVYRNSMGSDNYTIVFGLIPYIEIRVLSQTDAIYNARIVDILFNARLQNIDYFVNVNPVTVFLNIYLYYKFLTWIYHLGSIIFANIKKILGKRKRPKSKS